MKNTVWKWVSLLVVIGVAIAAYQHIQTNSTTSEKRKRDTRPIPVEIAPITRGAIAQKRIFSGTLQARAQFLAAPKVSGRINKLYVGLADTIQRGQIVAELDNAEYIQAVAQAKAALAVAKADLQEAQNLFKLASRELNRVSELANRDLSSAALYDAAEIDKLVKQSQVDIAKAKLAQAESELNTSNIRLGYTTVRANWHGGSSTRVVSEKLTNEGETIAANSPLLRIIELDPINAIFYVTEREYAALRPGQKASVTTDIYPNEQFQGTIERIAPAFQENSRQARIEVKIDNADQRLKPGAFARIAVVFSEEQDAVIVPKQSIIQRQGETGVFSVANNQQSVFWQPVQTGISDDKNIQLLNVTEENHVVILGQQLLSNDSLINVTNSPVEMLP